MMGLKTDCSHQECYANKSWDITVIDLFQYFLWEETTEQAFVINYTSQKKKKVSMCAAMNSKFYDVVG